MGFLSYSSSVLSILIFQAFVVNCSPLCPSTEGYFRDPSDCSKFHYCQNGVVANTFQCGSGTVYNLESRVCDWPQNVNCESTVKGQDGESGKDSLGTQGPSSSSSETPSTAPPSPSTMGTPTSTASHQTSSQPEIETENPNEWHPPIGPTTTAEPDPSEGFKDDYVLVCYFTNWAWYRPPGGKFIPEDINPSYCTHINYGFAVLDGSSLTIKVHDSWADVDNQFLKRVVALKKKNPKLKVMLSLGGWNDSAGDKYSRLVNSPSARKNFIEHALTFLAKYRFDGLDLDWEYPKCWQAECVKGPESDKAAFADFVHELRAAFEPHSLLLTAAVSPSRSVIDAGYDVPALAKDFDFINVMAYDYHGQWEKFASHHSPLYARPKSASFDPFDNIFNVNFTIHHWIERGMPSRKLVLGMPLYGRSFVLAGNAESHPEKGYGMTATSGGEPGQFTREKGYLSYYEICDNVRHKGWKVERDESGVAFAHLNNQWVGYDDPKALEKKSEYIKQMNLLGGMVWALDLDDFTGSCCQTRYPLMKTLNAYLRGVKSFEDIKCV